MNTTKSTFIRARIEPKLKRNAERVLHTLGMNTTGAITMFLTQVSLQKGLPFAVNIPNKTTVAALNELLNPRSAYKNADEMLSDILNSK